MTTPSKNEIINLTGKMVRKIKKSSTVTDTVNYNPYGWRQHHQEHRPASSNSPRIGRKFKKCGAWTHSGWTWTSSDVTHIWRAPNTGWVFTDTGTLWNTQDFAAPKPIGTNIKNASLSKALERLKAQDFHIGNFVAEGRQTIDLLRGSALTIASAVNQYRTRRPKDWSIVKRIQRDGLPRYLWCKIPSSWLELQYGWKPLMSDIFGAAQHLSKRSRFGVPWVSVNAKMTDSYDTIESVHTGNGVYADAKFENQVEVSTFLIYGLSNPVLAEFSSLGLINPLEIIWETTRYSFVVDWFLPIGSWLSGLTADVGYTFISGGQSSKTSARFAGSTIRTVPHDAYTEYLSYPGPAYQGKRESFERTCYPGSPFPGLYVKNPISTLHLANALALLVQAFRK